MDEITGVGLGRWAPFSTEVIDLYKALNRKMKELESRNYANISLEPINAVRNEFREAYKRMEQDYLGIRVRRALNDIINDWCNDRATDRLLIMEIEVEPMEFRALCDMIGLAPTTSFCSVRILDVPILPGKYVRPGEMHVFYRGVSGLRVGTVRCFPPVNRLARVSYPITPTLSIGDGTTAAKWEVLSSKNNNVKEKEKMATEKPYTEREAELLNNFFKADKAKIRAGLAFEAASKASNDADEEAYKAKNALAELFFPGESSKVIQFTKDKVVLVRYCDGTPSVEVKPVLAVKK